MTPYWYHAFIAAWLALMVAILPFETFATLMLVLIFFTMVTLPWRGE